MADRLNELLGPMAIMIRPLISGVKVKFDAETKKLIVSKGDCVQEMPFEQIEQLVNGD